MTPIRAGSTPSFRARAPITRIAREPSLADKERVLSSLREYFDDSAAALNDDALTDDALPDDVVSGVRQIVKEAARPRARRLQAFEAAGREYAETGTLSEQTRAGVQRPMVDPRVYEILARAQWRGGAERNKQP